jgi:NADPH2:quinone reductase
MDRAAGGQAVPLPANIGMEAGPASTFSLSDRRAHRRQEGSTVLVAAGAGAVGHYAIQFAKQREATVIATVSSPAKGEIARQAGADHVIDYRRENVGDRIMALTAKRGVDAVIEVDLAANARLLPSVLAPNGVVAIYGSGAPEASIPFQFLLQNSITLKFFLVYLMPPEERVRATADITGMLERASSSATWRRRSISATSSPRMKRSRPARRWSNIVVGIGWWRFGSSTLSARSRYSLESRTTSNAPL